MIKNLLNADEEPPEGTKVVIEDSVVDVPANARIYESPTDTESSPTKTAAFEVPPDAQFFVNPAATTGKEKEELAQFSAAFDDIEKSAPGNENPEADILPPAEIRPQTAEETAAGEEAYSELLAHLEREEPEIFGAAGKTLDENFGETKTPTAGQADEAPKTNYTSGGTLFQSDYAPPSTEQTIRNSGLAWSAGVVLFGSVIFMMIFGWFADLLLGSSPWGLVGGIVLGGLIGIVQLFRITSQIYRK